MTMGWNPEWERIKNHVHATGSGDDMTHEASYCLVGHNDNPRGRQESDGTVWARPSRS